jgi:hypothetical protein
MAELCVQPYIVRAVLNHVSGARGIAGVYAAYGNEKTAVLALWAQHIDRVIFGTSRK